MSFFLFFLILSVANAAVSEISHSQPPTYEPSDAGSTPETDSWTTPSGAFQSTAEGMLESPDSPVVVWSRPPSLRSLRTGKRVVPGQYVLDEPDTLCVLPSSMRLVCCLLTLLLICSLVAAILNSLQGSSNGSVSYCKRPEEPFRPSILCPRESMFFYYKCCPSSDDVMKTECCSKIRIWLLLAIVCVVLSCLVGICYSIFRYFCRHCRLSAWKPTRLRSDV